MKKKQNGIRYNKCKAISNYRQEVDKISDEEQLSYWLDTYQNLIFSICYKMTGNYFDAEDLTQDTFLSVYRNIARFDGRNEKAWLARIATNKCLDYKRKGAAGEIPTEDEFFVSREDTSSEGSSEDACLQTMVMEELQQCCERLKPPYDEIANRFFYKEQSVAQIAQELDRNEKTVQTQIYRARAMLKKLYGKVQGREIRHG